MKFGPVPVGRAGGAILAHSVTAGGRKLRKGLLLEAAHVETLRAAGIEAVIVARLGHDDMHEDAAAARLASALVPDPEAAGLRLTEPFTGRVNLIAAGPGVVVLDAAAIAAFNAVDPMITVATVPQHQQMRAGGMVATVKVIAYGVRAAHVQAACDRAVAAIRLCAPVMRDAGLVITAIPGGPDDTKGVRAIADRLAALGMDLAECITVPHRSADLAAALARVGGDMALVLTGSATSDPDDVAPAALRAAGGTVARYGMPVDPGNLLFLGALDGRPVIGLPGCARSPALNGADWVLSRVACGLSVDAADIAAMGVGGLLKEIPTRPQPRAGRR
ncbi:MAG: molybdopterin-binding protein [Rhodobacteraceae bacterium]|nr:molybdopterin-binding protein [Paracoccaceae bacterium]